MKYILKTNFLIFMFSSFSWSQTLFPILGGQRAGTSVFSFLNIGVSARAAGMGERGPRRTSAAYEGRPRASVRQGPTPGGRPTRQSDPTGAAASAVQPPETWLLPQRSPRSRDGMPALRIGAIARGR